ncbi:MAG: S9 family peptidase [Planctomycetes bacterium]|nr:S9 family peptidase [Planctomycetota bacterium]
MLTGCVASVQLQVPETRRGDTVDDYHGTSIPDPYRWLETLDSDETKAWVAAQNAVSVPYLDQLPARGPFLERLLELRAVSSVGELRRQGGAWVTRRRKVDGGFELLIRNSLDESPTHRLDATTLGLSGDEKLDGYRLSPGAKYLGFAVSAGGSEFLEFRVLQLASAGRPHRLLHDRIPGLKFSTPYWTADGEHLVYWRYLNADPANRLEADRGGLVAVHRLGASPNDDRVLHRDEATEATGLSTWSELTADGRFVVLFFGAGNAVRLSVIDLGDPLRPDWGAPVVELMHAREGAHDLMGCRGGTLYFRTTRAAPLGRVVAVDIDRPTAWRTVIAEGEHLLQQALVVGDRIVAAYRRDVKAALVVFEPDGTEIREVPLPGIGSTFWLGGTPDAPDLVFGFDSFAVPPRLMHHDVDSGETRTLGTRQIPGFVAGDYVSRQVFYESKDGTRVPMFITSRSDIVLDGTTPSLLYGYGASGVVSDPIFRDDFFTWIEAGGIVAVANVRGGGEYGDAWYEAGRLEKKQNTYDDFIAAAEYLVAERFTSPRHLSILGYSNGGLLVGAVMTQRPELFAAAIPVVGVFDALRFPTTTAGPRWARSHGDPAIPEQFRWIYSWSPLHRIEDGACYPATLVLTAANDDLVHPSQSYKFAARLQTAQGCAHPAVLRVLESGGHEFWRWNQEANAEILAFAARHTGLTAAR